MAKTPQNTRANILKVALLLFIEKGYKNVSYSDLVKKTGMSKGGIYHYFTSKEALLVSVFDMFFDAGNQPATVDVDALVSDIESFRKLYIDIRMAQLREFKAFLGSEIANSNWILFCLEAVDANEELRVKISEIARREINFFENCFVCLQKKGRLPKSKDAALLAACLYYMLEGAGLVIFLAEKKRDEDFIKLFDKIIDDFFKII